MGPECEAVATMPDIIMLALVVICFALALAYARVCNNLLAPGADEDVTQ
jgi:hypothetical protein